MQTTTLEEVAATLKAAMHTEAGKGLYTGLDAYTADAELMLAALDALGDYADAEGFKLDEAESAALTAAYRAALEVGA
jgi:hypothetical protein